MKKLFVFLQTFTLLLLLLSCKKNATNIVVTLFPQYDMVKHIVGDSLSVKLLLKPGVEAHDFEPTSKDIIAINQAELFIHTSLEFDGHWLENIKKSQPKNLITLEDLLISSFEHEHEDLHFWTSTSNYLFLLNQILYQLINVYPEQEILFTENYQHYSQKILLEHKAFSTFLSSLQFKDLLFSGHNSMQYFGLEYGLNIHALSDSVKPNAEITSTQIINLVSMILTLDAQAIFIEELADQKVSAQIKSEVKRQNELLSLDIYELHGYHNLSLFDSNNKISYFDLLQRNITNIMKVLGDYNDVH